MNWLNEKKTGQFLRALNSPEFIANQFSQYILEEASLFDLPKAIESITVQEVEAFIQSLANEERITTFQLIPEEN